MREHTKNHPTRPSEAIVDICWGHEGEPQRYVVGAGHIHTLRAVVELMAATGQVVVQPRALAAAGVDEGTSWRSLATKTGHIEANNPQSEIAMTVRAHRKAQNMSQAELAKKLGCQQANVSAIERGKRAVGGAMAKKLAKIFKVDASLFL